MLDFRIVSRAANRLFPRLPFIAVVIAAAASRTVAYSSASAAEVPNQFWSSLRHRRASHLFASAGKNSEPHEDPEGEGLHTYVEGLNFGNDREKEILSMGGDPFFLPDEEEEKEMEEQEQSFMANEDVTSPSMAFMIGLQNMPGPLDVIGNDGASATSREGKEQIEETGFGRASSIPFEPAFGAGGLHTRAEGVGFDDMKEALLDIGGDPFFLEEDDEEDSGYDETQAQVKIKDEDEWDGWVIEDAHLDFD